MKHIAATALTALLIIAVSRELGSVDRFTYIGLEACARQCHNSDAIGNQYKLWQMSPHAKALRELQGEKAKEIAARVSVNDPATDSACLSCHTTGQGKDPLTRDEGVGCESCHGPGSGYHGASDHVDYIDRTGAYQKAIKKGMYPVLGIVDSHLKKREKLCLSCHSETRPCYPEDNNDRIKQKLTIQVIDKMTKGDVDIRHPLRR